MGDSNQGVGADIAVDEEQLHALQPQLLVGLGQLLLVGCVEVKLAADKGSDVLQFVLGLCRCVLCLKIAVKIKRSPVKKYT